jgi:hypothetical protein
MKKNSASKASVFKLVLFSQATQIALGYYTARSETFYLHSYHVQNLFEKIHNVSIFFTSGPCNSVMGPSTNISASCSNTQPSNTGGTRLDSVEAHQVIQSALETASQWQWLAALLLYWVFIPIWQFVLALLLQDAFQYFMHRLNHTKWLYSISPLSSLRRLVSTKPKQKTFTTFTIVSTSPMPGAHRMPIRWNHCLSTLSAIRSGSGSLA